jgi:hypothetical protein
MPGILLITVAAAAQGTAISVAMDMTAGIIDRFRTMAIAQHLPAATTRLVRLPQARHRVFRDRPDLAFPAVREFLRDINRHPAL